MANKHKGLTFDSFLEEEKLLDEVEAVAIKRVVTYELGQVMEKNHLSKSEKSIKSDLVRIDKTRDENIDYSDSPALHDSFFNRQLLTL